MSIKEEMPTIDSPGEAMSFTQQLTSLSVRWKIRIAYWAGILLTASLVIIMVSAFQRRAAIHHAYDKVYLLRTTRTKLAEAWFNRLTDRIKGYASDRETLDMLGLLTESFLNIENDNYTTPGAETPEKITSILKSYYTTEIIPVLEGRMEKKIPLNSVMPSDNKQKILQYLYLAANTRPLGSKSGILRAADGSLYSTLHGQFQPEIINFARESGISDIFLIDYKTGYVIYSLQKNPDFGTELYEGPYHKSGLGMAFKAAIGLPAGSFQITDESIYTGNLLQPALFISAPVFEGNEIKGAVVFAVGVAALDNILATDNEGLADLPGLKSFFIGTDLLYRNNDPALAIDSKRYVRRMKRLAEDGMAWSGIEQLKTTAMVQQVNPLAFSDGTGGKEKQVEYLTETGERVISSYGPISVPGLKWLLVSQLDKSQAIKPVRVLTRYLILMSIVLSLLVYIMIHKLSDRLADRLIVLGGSLHSGIQSGKNADVLKIAGDEIDAAVSVAQLLKERIHEASKYADMLSEGNLETEISFDGEDDKLGTSLHNLKNVLISRMEKEQERIREDEIRNWSTQGVALFNDILRMDNNDLDKLSLNIIRTIIQYLSANQGGIFLIDKEDGSAYLDLVASYAFDRQKFLKKRIGIGEGLAGTCALEKKTILLGRIPDNYMEITSGLGGAKPSCLLIVPLKKDEEVLGVMEIASFNPIKPHEVEFVEKVAESIASALVTVRLHMQTSRYLERFQQQAEEMKAQDEELRQNIEELQATHEQMERMKTEEDERNQKLMQETLHASEELQKEKALLDALLNSVPEHIYFKDMESKFLRFSKSMLKLFGMENAGDLKGKSDFDFFDEEHSRPAYEGEQEIIRTGIAIIDLEEKEIMEDGRVSWVNTTKMPLRNARGEIIGTFGISKDITKLKKLEEEVNKKMRKL